MRSAGLPQPTGIFPLPRGDQRARSGAALQGQAVAFACGTADDRTQAGRDGEVQRDEAGLDTAARSATADHGAVRAGWEADGRAGISADAGYQIQARDAGDDL